MRVRSIANLLDFILQVTWLRDGKPLEDGNNVSMYSEGFEYYLKISDCTLRDDHSMITVKVSLPKVTSLSILQGC